MHHHGHHHGHHHCHDHDHARQGNKKGLTIALFITAGIMLLEFIGGLLTNSLALFLIRVICLVILRHWC